MKKTLPKFIFLLLSGLLSVIPQAFSELLSSKVIKVNSIPALQQAINDSGPGDRIVLANGVYTTKESIVIKNIGTSVNKITIQAESAGGAEISGTNGFVIIPRDEGQMLSIQGPGGDKMAKRTWIHHNYFHDFTPPGKNNCSAIQVGLSGRSMDSAFCVIEYNLFVRTEGENEGAICHKACNNIIRYNTFGERSEELSLRHGNNSQVYGNFFIKTTGLRFSGDDHLIYNNYFLDCSKAIVCTNGDGEVKEGSKLTCHDRPDRVRVEYNTIIDCKSSYQMAVRNAGLGATKIIFTNNIIRGGEPVSIRDSYPDAVWKDNILFNASGGDMSATGFTISEISKNHPFFMKTPEGKGYTLIPETNRPLSVSDVGFDVKKN